MGFCGFWGSAETFNLHFFYYTSHAQHGYPPTGERSPLKTELSKNVSSYPSVAARSAVALANTNHPTNINTAAAKNGAPGR